MIDELRDDLRTATTGEANTFGAVAESWIRDPGGTRVDIAEHAGPIERTRREEPG